MNPEEGELRPQLLDRFGLSVEIRSPTDPRQRAEVVRRRLTHDAGGRVDGGEGDIVLRARLAAAMPADLPDQVVDFACRLAVSVGAEGLRADLVLCRAAAAFAGWEGRSVATTVDVERVAAVALGHRRRRRPFDPPILSPGELERAVEAAAEVVPRRQPGPAVAARAGDRGGPGAGARAGRGPGRRRPGRQPARRAARHAGRARGPADRLGRRARGCPATRRRPRAIRPTRTSSQPTSRRPSPTSPRRRPRPRPRRRRRPPQTPNPRTPSPPTPRAPSPPSPRTRRPSRRRPPSPRNRPSRRPRPAAPRPRATPATIRRRPPGHPRASGGRCRARASAGRPSRCRSTPSAIPRRSRRHPRLLRLLPRPGSGARPGSAARRARTSGAA